MVEDPAIDAVLGFGGFGAGFGEVFDEFEEGRGAFGEVADFGGPVVHFEVDVGGVFAAPGRQDGFVPDALEVGRLAAGAAAGGEEVAAELEAEGFEIGIGGAVALGEEALVGGRGALGGVAEGEVHTAHEAAEIVDVPAEEGGEVFGGDVVKDFFAAGGGVGGDVVVIDEVGGFGKDEGDSVGVVDVQGGAGGVGGSAFLAGGEGGFEAAGRCRGCGRFERGCRAREQGRGLSRRRPSRGRGRRRRWYPCICRRAGRKRKCGRAYRR